MPKNQKLKQQQMRTRIAATAARIMAEDGVDDFAMAKRKAARQLGADDTQSLPANDEIESELRAYQSLYQEDEQRERIQALRAQALAAMEALAEFKPYLTGSVLKGTAGRYSDIDLQLFADSGKEVEIFLLNRNISYETEELRHYSGGQARAVSVLTLDWDGTPVRVAVYSANDERGSVKTSPLGRPLERAGLDAVRALVASGA
jgi:predicted nucleotidyltransferase